MVFDHANKAIKLNTMYLVQTDNDQEFVIKPSVNDETLESISEKKEILIQLSHVKIISTSGLSFLALES